MTPPFFVGEAVAARARALCGVPFRLGGRDPATGLDCIGLALAALARDDLPSLPTGYSLGPTALERWHHWLRRAGAVAVHVEAMPCPGDLLIVDAGRGRYHALIAVEEGAVHADAALRRVVLSPYPLRWCIASRWQFC